MAFTHFLQNPKSYLRTHQVFIGNSFNAGGSVAPLAAAALIGGGHSMQFNLNPAAFITMTDTNITHVSSKLGAIARGLGLAPRVRRDFTVAVNPAGDIGFRFLPYRQGHVTYMSLGAAATFFITGPLTGCTVGAGSLGGNIWTFHSYAPAGIHGAAARDQQSLMIDEVGNTLGLNAIHLAENGTDYNGQGFVFGRLRPNGIWKFYAYGSASGVRKICEL